jgi:hypothetical protein
MLKPAVTLLLVWREYARAVAQFFTWMDKRGLARFRQLSPVHVAAWVESMVRRG